ncbi:MAG: alpha/beta fold hydrolase, partial [Acidobacteriaceae bacterium]
MNFVLRAGCWLFDRILALHTAELRVRYGDEMRIVFREQLQDACGLGPVAVLSVLNWTGQEMIAVAADAWLGTLRLIAFSACVAAALFFGVTLSFATFDAPAAVHACASGEPQAAVADNSAIHGRLVPISGGHKMFLECAGETDRSPTVILATGRGLGSYQAWSLVQSRVALFARVCSYDPLGAGRSDRVGGTHPVSEVVSNMHDLFHNAGIQEPLILVGASAGGILIRRYEERYPAEVAGFVFADSAHEEQEWRDGAISAGFDPSWNDPQFLRDNGFLPPQQHLHWHDDVPLIVLERTDLPPCSAFPGLTQRQCDQINEEWHSFQVDLSRRSRYGQLRAVSGSGHAMQQQRPDAIAQAVKD